MSFLSKSEVITNNKVMDEETSILYKNTITYLHNLGQTLPNGHNVLKSYYAAKHQISQLQTKIHIQKSKGLTCPRCCLKLQQTGSAYCVRPETQQSKFAIKVTKKAQNNKALTNYQTKYLKKGVSKTGNTLVITCRFCKKQILRKCEKPVKLKIIEPNTPLTVKSKKKSKKKDKFCGLKTQAVVSVQKLKGNENRNGNQSQLGSNHKTQNLVINKKKHKCDQRKNMIKLSNVLSSGGKSNTKSGLFNFLQSFNK